MKNIVIISSYPNTQEKSDVLLDYILQVKKMNYDVLLVSHLPIPQNILQHVNYHIYDKENFLLPKERSPVIWFADAHEYINLYCSRHAYVIVKNIYNSLNFVNALGYDNFIFSEGDNIISDDGIQKFQSIFDVLEKSDKKLFVFKVDNQIYNKYNMLYRTNFFAGNVNYFIKNIPLVKSFEEWCVVPPYANGSELLETLFLEMTLPLKDKVHEEITEMETYFNNSKIDVFHVFDNFYPVLYNLEDKNKPMFFVICKDGLYELYINNNLAISKQCNKGEQLKHTFNINENDTIVQLKHNGIVVMTKTINSSSIEECKNTGIRGSYHS